MESNLWEVAAWEIANLGRCDLGNWYLRSHPWETAFRKVPNTHFKWSFIYSVALFRVALSGVALFRVALYRVVLYRVTLYRVALTLKALYDQTWEKILMFSFWKLNSFNCIFSTKWLSDILQQNSGRKWHNSTFYDKFHRIGDTTLKINGHLKFEWQSI